MSPQLDTARRLGREAFVHRLIAFIVDAIMIGVVVNILFAVFWFSIFYYGAFLWWLLPSILMAIYMFVMESSGGQTIGKMLLGVRVVREDLGPVTANEVKGRCIGVMLYPLIIPWILDLLLVSGEGQSLGDRWAHTTVIKVP